MAVIIRKKRASQRADGRTDERDVDGELRSPPALLLRPPFIFVPRCINLDRPIFLILLHTNICFLATQYDMEDSSSWLLQWVWSID